MLKRYSIRGTKAWTKIKLAVMLTTSDMMRVGSEWMATALSGLKARAATEELTTAKNQLKRSSSRLME